VTLWVPGFVNSSTAHPSPCRSSAEGTPSMAWAWAVPSACEVYLISTRSKGAASGGLGEIGADRSMIRIGLAPASRDGPGTPDGRPVPAS
jgi:hypothetical protein